MSTYPDRFDRLHKALVADAAQHPTYPPGSEALAGYSEGAEHALDSIRRAGRGSGDNTHFASASDALELDAADTGSYLDPQTRALTVAQIEATLALAYEQRTANLLAFERNMIEARRGGNLSPEGRELWLAASKESIERLGLA